MEEPINCTHIIVYKSDNIEMIKLVKEFIEAIGCEVTMDKTIVRE